MRATSEEGRLAGIGSTFWFRDYNGERMNQSAAQYTLPSVSNATREIVFPEARHRVTDQGWDEWFSVVVSNVGQLVLMQELEPGQTVGLNSRNCGNFEGVGCDYLTGLNDWHGNVRVQAIGGDSKVLAILNQMNQTTAWAYNGAAR